VAVFVGVGFGRVVGVARGELALFAARTVAAVDGAAVCGLFRAAGFDGVAVGVPVAVADADVIGGGCDACTRTLPEPLLHAVTASARQSPAATVPGVPMPA
jgi:hypothetical protein